MKNKNITLLTAPIHSGKTTAIERWLQGKTQVKGILTPDKEGLRKIVDLSNGEIFPFQIAESQAIDDITIGKYIFSKAAFEKGQNILFALCASPTQDLIIIDEIGKLELHGKGFEPALGQFLEQYKNLNTPLLLVIRDYLLEDIIEKYQLQDANIQVFDGEIHLDYPPPSQLNGLVLAGGYSQRMKQDKADLNYHHKPQYQYVYDLLQPFCQQLFISCKLGKTYPLPCIYDKENEIQGPIAGLFAAFSTIKTAWLVVAIDYPFFNFNAVEQLLQERDLDSLATVYYNAESHFFEPYLGIYEAAFFDILATEIATGNFSLQKILQRNLVKKVIPQNPIVLKSVDTLEDYLHTKVILHRKNNSADI